MEAFSSLKFWRDAGPGPGDVENNVDVRNRAPETYNGDYDEDESFFELVFTAPDVEINCNEEKTVHRMLANESACNNAGKYHTIEYPFKSKGVGSNGKPQSPIALLKSVPKFRVLLLGFKKGKPARTAPVNEDLARNKSPMSVQSKRFSFECEVEEIQIASLFSRDNSLRSKIQRRDDSDFQLNESTRRSPRDFPDFPKYLRLIKPLYVRASKRYSESPRPSSDLSSSTDSSCSSPATALSISPTKLSEEKRGKRYARFGVLGKHLGKSRSVSSAVRRTTPPSTATRRDDSLLLQNDGIQSAILHCKRSLYNTPTQEYTALWRSVSCPTNGKSSIPASNSSKEQIRCSSI